jgi:hypothetical protein
VATNTGSAASSPATIMTSSAPIHGGTSEATTIGAPVEPPNAAASIAPAPSAAPRVATQITVRGG